jgi:hypothetical protein
MRACACRDVALADGEAAQHLCAVEHCLGDLDGLLLVGE